MDQGVQVIGVNTWKNGQTPTNVRNVYITPTGTTYPVCLDGDTLTAKYGGSGVEDYFVIRRDTIISYSQHGYNTVAVEAALDEALMVSDVSDDSDQGNIPSEFALEQNYPNPFNPQTTIRFSLINSSPLNVTLKIYNLLGDEIAVLLNEKMTASNYSILWNGVDGNNRPVSSGIYFYELRVGERKQIKRMVLVR